MAGRGQDQDAPRSSSVRRFAVNRQNFARWPLRRPEIRGAQEGSKSEKRSRIHYIIVDHTGNIVDSLAFEHFDKDRVVKGQPFLPDDQAEKRK